MAWSEEEVRETTSVYFEMWKRQLRGEDFVKAEYLRAIASKIGRSVAAVTRKFHNISAVLVELGYTHMDGYTTQSHYQNLLKAAVADQLEDDQEIHRLLAEEAKGQPQDLQQKTALRSVLEPPPDESDISSWSQDQPTRQPRKIDYIERERRNRDLGKAGEEYVVELERDRLQNQGFPELADQVEWVAKTRGDGLGYDVLSFDTDGTERYIEVKTTKQGKSLPFYLSASELEFSKEAGNQFYIYRVYRFKENDEPSLYILNGPVDETCVLTPEEFRVQPAVS